MPALLFLIDDDPISRFMLSKIITDSGLAHTTKQFVNGLEAIAYLQIKENQTVLPDLIFLDLEMPLMDGWQFLEEYSLLNFPKTIPIYIVSSSASFDDLEKAKTISLVNGYLIKPVAREEVLQVLQTTITS